MRGHHVACVVVAAVLGACRGGEGTEEGGRAGAGGAARTDSSRGDAAGRAVAAVGTEDRADGRVEVRFSAANWRPPADSEIPNDSAGASIRRGLALVTHTTDSLPQYAPGRINCTNCHVNAGRNVEAAPLTGAHARYPKYMDRTGAVITLNDRVNYCFTRSLAGAKIPTDSREMEDILAYIAFISRGVPVGEKTPGAGGLIAMPRLAGDAGRGAEVYAANCAACHQADGQGNPAIPPGIPALWGAKSYSIGASMAREERAASFIWHNMPYGRPKTLTHQQAYDVSAYINSKPRPDSPGKADDWPAGGAPYDVPYDTKSGHRAFKPPPALARPNPAGALVPQPRSVKAPATRVTRSSGED